MSKMELTDDCFVYKIVHRIIGHKLLIASSKENISDSLLISLNNVFVSIFLQKKTQCAAATHNHHSKLTKLKSVFPKNILRLEIFDIK